MRLHRTTLSDEWLAGYGGIIQPTLVRGGDGLL
jgi:hypothetical protein